MRPVPAQFRDKSRNIGAGGDSKILVRKEEGLQRERPVIFIEYQQISVIKTASHRLLDQVVVLEIFPAAGKTTFPKTWCHIARVLKDEHMAARQVKLGCRRVG